MGYVARELGKNPAHMLTALHLRDSSRPCQVESLSSRVPVKVGVS